MTIIVGDERWVFLIEKGGNSIVFNCIRSVYKLGRQLFSFERAYSHNLIQGDGICSYLVEQISNQVVPSIGCMLTPNKYLSK